MEFERTIFSKINIGEKFAFRHEIIEVMHNKKIFPVVLLWEKVGEVEYKAGQIIFDFRKNSLPNLPNWKGTCYERTEVYTAGIVKWLSDRISY